jgi:hypothetical protein
MMFYDPNPFAIKRDEIEGVITSFFTAIAVLATFIQVCTLISEMQDRLHSTGYYKLVFVISLAASAIIIVVLTAVGNQYARQRWLPKVIENQMENYQTAKFIIEHEGWRKEQLPTRDTLINPERYRAENRSAADNHLEQIERLLEITPLNDDLSQRLAQIKDYFEP